jgi:hypothetical protein
MLCAGASASGCLGKCSSNIRKDVPCLAMGGGSLFRRLPVTADPNRGLFEDRTVAPGTASQEKRSAGGFEKFSGLRGATRYFLLRSECVLSTDTEDEAGSTGSIT